MINSNYFEDNDDLKMHFDYFLDLKKLVDEYENGFEEYKKYNDGDERFYLAPADADSAIEFYRETLASCGELSGKYLSQYAQGMDETGLKLENGKVIFPEHMNEMWHKFIEAGLLPYTLRRANGGLGLPVTMSAIMNELMARADIAFNMALGLANLSETIERFASQQQIEAWLPKMVAGEYAGAMALSEPDYGSDLQHVKTRAVRQEDGSYRITGTKRFISNGCGMAEVPAVILTLARTSETDGGGRGLSFFIVDGKDVEVAGIEHKMGIRCSPTCEIVYDNAPAEIIGEEGRGLTKYAMGMMNGARLSVGTCGVGVSTAALYEARKYASERVQFGQTINKLPAVQKMLDRMEREVAAMRSINLEAAYMIDMYKWRSARLEAEGKQDRDIRKDDQVKYWEKLATLFTPLTKLYGSEIANDVCSDAIQIHGGAGYCEEYDVARLYRDARILPIYEGTTQLQVVAAIGGVAAGMKDSGVLRQWIDNEAKNFKLSAESREVEAMLVEALELYKNLENADDRDYIAAEVVWICARLVCGILLERTVDLLEKAGSDARDQRAEYSIDFNIDSIALAKGNVERMKRFAAKKAS